MPTTRTAFHGTLRAVLLLCLLWIFASHAKAQDYGVVDTIRVSDQTQYVQAYHDTVLIFERSGGDGIEDAWGFTRFGRGAPWDSVVVSTVCSKQPPMKGCAIGGHRAASGDRPASYWILRDARTTRIVPVARPGDQITAGSVDRIRVHPANTKKIYAQCESKVSGGFITTTYVTNDDGENWKEIKTPILPGDVARAQWLNFDYNYPNRLFITVDPSGRANPDAASRDYYTDDDGETFGIYYLGTPWAVGYGIWGKTSWVYGNSGAIQFYSDSIGLLPGSSPGYVKPPWLENVRTSLFPNYDSTKQKLGYAMSDLTDYNGTVGGLAFHPERPLTFAVTFHIDTLVDGKWYNRGFVVATRDFGETWSFILPPSTTLGGYFHSPTSLSIDPFEDAVYASVIKRFIDPVTSKETILGTYTIKCTPRTTSVAGENPRAFLSSLMLYPNPASQGANVTITMNEGVDDAANVNASLSCRALDGRIVSTQFTHDRSTGSGNFIMSTSELAPGIYIVQVRSRNTTESKLLVVTR